MIVACVRLWVYVRAAPLSDLGGGRLGEPSSVKQCLSWLLKDKWPLYLRK